MILRTVTRRTSVRGSTLSGITTRRVHGVQPVSHIWVVLSPLLQLLLFPSGTIPSFRRIHVTSIDDYCIQLLLIVGNGPTSTLYCCFYYHKALSCSRTIQAAAWSLQSSILSTGLPGLHRYDSKSTTHVGTRKAQACVILLLNIRGNPRFYHHSTQIILFSYCYNKPLYYKDSRYTVDTVSAYNRSATAAHTVLTDSSSTPINRISRLRRQPVSGVLFTGSVLYILVSRPRIFLFTEVYLHTCSIVLQRLLSRKTPVFTVLQLFK